ncbi:MAG TPA: sensor histidine kinase [Marmoricola sp.]|nr:sensor histidine kinase [Marmoricola sp.]
MVERLPPWRDALVPGAVAAVAVVEVLANTAIRPEAVALIVELGLAAALWWRHQRPLLAVGAVAVLQVVEALAGVPLEQPLVPLLASAIVIYALVAHGSLGRGLAGLAMMVVAVAVETVAQDKGLANFTFAMVFAIGTFMVARTVAYRTRHADAMQERADEVELRREDDLRRAAEAERTRIARELHDVVAHSVGVMVVQAGAAERVLERDPESAVAALHAVQTTGRQAIAEMARLVSMLREGGEEIGLAPQPGLDDLAALVEDARRAGLPVDLRIEGSTQPVPPALGLTVYRIVQEALTNVRKHAGAARATVLLDYRRGALVAEISDTGDGTSLRGPGTGHGLIGMRERVAMYGGTLDVGASAGGGFSVRARLPIEVEA